MHTIDGKTAKRYARSLLDVVLAAGPDQEKLDKQLSALRAFAEAWGGSAELREAVLNPAYKAAEKQAVVSDIAAKIFEDKYFKNFLLVMFENKRLGGVKEIADSLELLIAELKNSLSLEIATATELSADEKQQIENKMQQDFGSLATVSWKVESDLIGGMVVRAGDKLLDGSIKGNLERMKAQLAA